MARGFEYKREIGTTDDDISWIVHYDTSQRNHLLAWIVQAQDYRTALISFEQCATFEEARSRLDKHVNYIRSIRDKYPDYRPLPWTEDGEEW